MVFECVINISEGQDPILLTHLEWAAGGSLRDRHSDEWHNRSVFTLINEPAPLLADVQRLLGAAIARLDIGVHRGVHPRLGVVDVVPFVPLDEHTIDEAVALRDELGEWVARTFGIPVFFYGPLGNGERTLPEVRRTAFTTLAPDRGPATSDPRAGAVTIGARPLLVAWNLWLTNTSIERTKQLAAALRRPGVRTLGLTVGPSTQVSCNIIEVTHVSLGELYDDVAASLREPEELLRAELVGLTPQVILERVAPTRWSALGLSPEATIEARRTRPYSAGLGAAL